MTTNTTLAEVVIDAALAFGAQPRSVRFVVRDAAEIFTVGDDGRVQPRDPAAHERGDPTRPLSVVGWLAMLREDEPNLFLPIGR